jgi:hypothetical protein
MRESTSKKYKLFTWDSELREIDLGASCVSGSVFRDQGQVSDSEFRVQGQRGLGLRIKTKGKKTKA